VFPLSAWQLVTAVIVALVPIRLIVCGLPTPLLFTVNVAASLLPDAWLGVNLKMIVQSDPLPTAKPFEHVPKPVLEKSAAFAPVMV
jgi:hypothetical protein